MLELNFTPFPELTTDRFVLRRFTEEDTAEMYYFRSDPIILQYLDKDPCPSLEEAKAFINRINKEIDENNSILWAIAFKDNPATSIGSICYWQLMKAHHRAEMGYLVAPAYWSKGVMKEVMPVVLEYGFRQMGLHSVEARLNPGNKASAAVLERAGFSKEAHFKEDFFYNGKYTDTLVYGLVNPYHT